MDDPPVITMAQFQYPLMVPPFRMRGFDDLSENKAREYFDWFVGQSKERLDLLIKACVATGGASDSLDFTPASLVPLWEWASRFAEVEPEERTKARHAADPLPDWAVAARIRRRELATGTLALVVDIGFYIAEVFIRNYPKVHWELWTRTDDYYFHRPVLVGFGYPLVPHDLSMAAFWCVIDGEYDKEELLRSFRTWERHLTEPNRLRWSKES